MTLENKKKIVEGITRVFEEISIPRDATTGIICEKPKENWASGSKLLSERYVNRGP
jgi:4-oxalocrotonate tautomerase